LALPTPCDALASVWLLAALPGIGSVNSQEISENQPSTLQTPHVPAGFKEQTSKNAAAPCLEPPPLPGISDYDGPMKKTVGLFARPLERKSVHQPHYRAGVPLCSLQFDDKFMLFVEDLVDPATFLGAGVDALSDQASKRDPAFGQGFGGYTRRFGANLADRTSSRFFKDFAYPTIFFEDPRYYRLGQGGTRHRLLHATEHLFVAHSPNGTRMFNYSEWLGTGSSVVLNNLYHPGNERGAGAMARRTGYRFAWDIGFDILREFWPDIAHKAKLPFRGAAKPDIPNSGSLTPGTN